MPKKVYELSNELGLGAIDLVEKLKTMGMNVRNHMVSLSDEQVEEAIKVLAPAPPKKTTKKKATTKKKVAKKKVVKKVVKKATEEAPSESETKKLVKKSTADSTAPAESESSVSAKQESEDKTASKKTPTVIRKKKDDLEKEAEKEKTNLYKEKVHTFTPVAFPESKSEQEERTETKRPPKSFPDQAPPPEGQSEDGEDDKSKKKIGDLAAHMSKKSVATRGKDLNVMRADEQLKFATGIVGKTIFTPAKKKKIYTGPTQNTEITKVKESKRVVALHDGATAEELAQKLSQKFDSFANKALELNLLVRKEDYIGMSLAEEISALYNYRVENKAFDEAEVIEKTKAKASNKDFPLRNPIITVMGHVDHGKTTLLDYIRNAKVASGEAGGITQHIGAYTVEVKGSHLTFLDTPGHAAFAAMRQRGADITDVVILVVAADDGVMPQTKESIRFCQEAEKSIIVAVNKMDKEGANPDRIKQELMEFGITPEEWGGETQFVPISALQGDGIDALLEAVQLQAEMMELRASAKGGAEGVVIESKVEQGRGPVATILIQKGTLKKGDSIVVGETFGRARSLMDDAGKMLPKAGPSSPVQVLGLNDVASPGDTLHVVKNEREAKKVVDNRVTERRALENAPEKKVASLEDFFSSSPAAGEAEQKVLKLIVRSDVHGSYEAIKNSLENLGNQEVSVQVVGGGVGAITDNDVLMAESTQGYIIGFNMRPVTSARRLAEQKGVDIKNYSIIYDLINDIKLALEGMLDPEYVEKYIGRAEVRDTFNIPKVGVIAGSAVIDGKIERGCNVRLLRDGKVVHDGKLSSLKRFKDDVKEVKNGYECGISLENFNDVKVKDVFEAYIMEERKRKLEVAEAVT